MKNTLFTALALSVFIAVPAFSGNDSQPPAKSLFNGKNLDGWYTFLNGKGKNVDPNQVFTVQDGLIHISGQELGCITSNEEFENYRLTVEFKWGDKTWAPRAQSARDSGILIHSTGEDGAFDGTWMYSIECQVIEGGTGDMLVVGDGSDQFSITCPVAAEKQNGCGVFDPFGAPATIHGGRINWWGRDPGWKDARDFRGARDVEKPVGQWNTMECVARGNEVLIYLNGTLVNHATKVQPAKGRIQIQSEAAELYVRKVEVLPLQ
jgi:hypothetical protein